jgi:hypothetical protein
MKDMQHKTKIHWQKNMAFDARVNGHTIRMDADETGGRQLALNPCF